MEHLGVMLLLSFVTETLVEAVFGRLFDNIPALLRYKWLLLYIAIAVGITGAWVYQFDILYELGLYLNSDLPVTPFGITLTGIAIGMGASYIHQLISQFFPAK